MPPTCTMSETVRDCSAGVHIVALAVTEPTPREPSLQPSLQLYPRRFCASTIVLVAPVRFTSACPLCNHYHPQPVAPSTLRTSCLCVAPVFLSALIQPALGNDEKPFMKTDRPRATAFRKESPELSGATPPRGRVCRRRHRRRFSAGQRWGEDQKGARRRRCQGILLRPSSSCGVGGGGETPVGSPPPLAGGAQRSLRPPLGRRSKGGVGFVTERA